MKQTFTLALTLFLGHHASVSLAQCASTPTNKGVITWYDVPPSSQMNCAFPENVLPDLPTIALGPKHYFGPNQYTKAQLCGACVEAEGPRGKVVFMVRDQCPECKDDHVDIEKSVRSKLADPNTNFFDGKTGIIKWKVVPCPISANSPVRFALKGCSNRYWAAIQVRNGKYPIKQLAYRDARGNYIALERTADNYFLIPGDKMPDGGVINRAVTFRVTDVNNNNIIERDIKMPAPQPGRPQGASVGGQHQFPNCASNRRIADGEAALNFNPNQTETAVSTTGQVERGMALWPNPATNTVQFAWQDFDETPVLLTVVNSKGSVIAQKQIDNLASYELSTSHLPDGLYHLSLQSGQTTTRSTLVIKH